MRRREFGNVRRLPSGRWQARYLDSTGRRRTATFTTRTAAGRHLAATGTDLTRGTWTPPEAGQTQLADYAWTWLAGRHVRGRPLAPRTRERYTTILRRHILPDLGHLPLAQLTPATVRGWHASLAGAAQPGTRGGAARPGTGTVAKAYRLLHAICATAVVDEHITRNPCTIRGAGMEHSAERPVATIDQIHTLAHTIGPRWKALIWLATYCGLRFGECAALTRDKINLTDGTVAVTEDLDELDDGTLQPGRVKSAAGYRTVTIPVALLPDIAAHLERYVAPHPDAVVFLGAQGARLRRRSFARTFTLAASRVPDLPSGFRFHDLRHTGNTLAAATGASTRELMHRLGHNSPRAALIYQHATHDRDTHIANTLSTMITGDQTLTPHPAIYRIAT